MGKQAIVVVVVEVVDPLRFIVYSGNDFYNLLRTAVVLNSSTLPHFCVAFPAGHGILLRFFKSRRIAFTEKGRRRRGREKKTKIIVQKVSEPLSPKASTKDKPRSNLYLIFQLILKSSNK